MPLSGHRILRHLVQPFDPCACTLARRRRESWIGKQLDKRRSDAWRDVHDDMPTVKLARMRESTRVRDHLEIPLEGKRVVADPDALVRRV